MTNVLIRDRKGDEMPRGKVKSRQRLEWYGYKPRKTRNAEVEKGKEGFSTAASMECLADNFGHLASRTMEKWISVGLSYQICDNMLWQL